MKKKLALSLLLSSVVHANVQWKPEELVEKIESVRKLHETETLRTIEEASQEEEFARTQEEKRHYEEEIQKNEDSRALEEQTEAVETVTEEQNLQAEVAAEEQEEKAEQEEVLDIYQMLEHIKQHILQLHPHHQEAIKIISHELIEMLEIIKTVSIKQPLALHAKKDSRGIDFGAYNDWVGTEDKTKQIDEEDTRYPQEQQNEQD